MVIPAIHELQTDRLILRQWQNKDLAAFAELNADPTVMEYFPAILTHAESNAMAERCRALITNNGWGFWAVELKDEGKFIGFVGLHQIDDKFPFSPEIEVGWRLAKKYWHHGYATEAAKRALQFAFEILDVNNIVAFTSIENSRSQSVMERIGMSDTKNNFMHPHIPHNHPLAEHVLYNIQNISN